MKQPALALYTVVLYCYRIAIGIAALVSEKARLWLAGRKNWKEQLESKVRNLNAGKRIWIHCASLGEFEQGRPVIEELKKKYPGCLVILTFFSPSGYEIRKDYEQADLVCYLPLDSRKNAHDFVAILQPQLALFVKYEFWYHYLSELHRKKIPALLISAAFRKEQPFFKWYGKMFRDLLSWFGKIFVQDEKSLELLGKSGLAKNALLSGDTRYDRVLEIARHAPSIPKLEAFKGDSQLLIAGSTWPADEKILASTSNVLPVGWKLIIAPHEIDASHIQSIENQFRNQCLLYSDLTGHSTDKKVLIIDNMGMLSSIFAYGTIAYIGGGFNEDGIHNVLEPAVFGLPVLFGPAHQKFVEAVMLVKMGFAFPLRDSQELRKTLESLIGNQPELLTLSRKLRNHIKDQEGATVSILNHIEQSRYLA